MPFPSISPGYGMHAGPGHGGPAGGHHGGHSLRGRHPGWQRFPAPQLVEISPVTPLLRAATVEVQKAIGGVAGGLAAAGPSLQILTNHVITSDGEAFLVSAGLMALAAQELGPKGQPLAQHAGHMLQQGHALLTRPKKPAAARARILHDASGAVQAAGGNAWVVHALEARAAAMPGAANVISQAVNAFSGWFDTLTTGLELNPLNPFSPYNPVHAAYDTYTRRSSTEAPPANPSPLQTGPTSAPSSWSPAAIAAAYQQLAPVSQPPPEPTALDKIKASPYAIPIAVVGGTLLLAVVVSLASKK